MDEEVLYARGRSSLFYTPLPANPSACSSSISLFLFPFHYIPLFYSLSYTTPFPSSILSISPCHSLRGLGVKFKTPLSHLPFLLLHNHLSSYVYYTHLVTIIFHWRFTRVSISLSFISISFSPTIS